MIRNRIYPQWTEEQLTSILEDYLIRECPDKNFELPSEVWNTILDTMREVSRMAVNEVYESMEESGEEGELVEKYKLTFLGNEKGSCGWCGIYKDGTNKIYSINRGDRMGGGRDYIEEIAQIPELEKWYDSK